MPVQVRSHARRRWAPAALRAQRARTSVGNHPRAAGRRTGPRRRSLSGTAGRCGPGGNRDLVPTSIGTLLAPRGHGPDDLDRRVGRHRYGVRVITDGPFSAQDIYDTAKSIATSDEPLAFPEAYLLCRLVMEFGGGPLNTRSRTSPRFDKKSLRRLEKAGWIERGGHEGAPRAKVSSLMRLPAGSWSATATIEPGALMMDLISASDEAIELVTHFVSPPVYEGGAGSTPADPSEDNEVAPEEVLAPWVGRRLLLVFSRAEVESVDFTSSSPLIDALASSYGRENFRQSVGIRFAGYDADPRELYEVPEVRRFVEELVCRLHWGYYLVPEVGGLQMMLLCLVQAERDGAGRARVNAARQREVASSFLQGALIDAGLVGRLSDEVVAAFRNAISRDAGVDLPLPERSWDPFLNAVDGRIAGLMAGSEVQTDDDDLFEDEPADPFEDVEEVGDLGDLVQLGDDLFSIWVGGAERRWAAYMWDVLERAGLTLYDDGDEVERTRVVCRLVALAGINREFAARAWQEGYPGEWRESVYAEVIGRYPLLDPIAVGRLAEREGVSVEPSRYDGREDALDLVKELAEREWTEVVRAILEDLGESWLFASLWATRNAASRYPLPDEVLYEILDTDVEEKVEAFGWVERGCV